MAHFAKINESNEVLAVLAVDDKDVLNASQQEEEAVGQQYLETHNNWPAHLWIQTSYNTRAAQHSLGGTPFRGNYAGIGYTWDAVNQIFWEPQPFSSFTKNISTASWDAPITDPTIKNDGADPVVYFWSITWNETAYQADNTKGWEAIKVNVDGTTNSDTAIYDWNGTAWVAQ